MAEARELVGPERIVGLSTHTRADRRGARAPSTTSGSGPCTRRRPSRAARRSGSSSCATRPPTPPSRSSRSAAIDAGDVAAVRAAGARGRGRPRADPTRTSPSAPRASLRRVRVGHDAAANGAGRGTRQRTAQRRRGPGAPSDERARSTASPRRARNAASGHADAARARRASVVADRRCGGGRGCWRSPALVGGVKINGSAGAAASRRGGVFLSVRAGAAARRDVALPLLGRARVPGDPGVRDPRPLRAALVAATCSRRSGLVVVVVAG